MDCLTASEYLQHLQALLPRGAAWPRRADANWTRLLDASSQELARVDCRANELFDQAMPDTTVELLPDWEEVLGLPDSCLPRDDTLESRREAVLARLQAQGGQNAAYFIDLAKWLGYSGGSVREFRPFTANSRCTDALYSHPWRHVWLLEVPEPPLGNESRDRTLECLLHRYKPGQTHVLVRYASPIYVLPGYVEPGYVEGDS